MAKQRKLLYPSGPDSFFDEMEREVNSTKRKKCKKVNQVPPEKLFLQFDPSKKDVSNSTKMVNSQPSLMQKPYWKPPIKMLSQPESFDLCNKLVPENSICSKSKDSTTKVIFSNDDNLKIISICLEENKSQNAEKGEENAELIIINSSPDSEKDSPETLQSDPDHNNCSEGGDSYEKNGDVVLLDNKTETAIQKMQECEEIPVIKTSQKEDTTAAEDCLQRLATDSNYYFEIKEPTIHSKNLSIGQDMNAILSEVVCPEISMGEVTKLSNKDNDNESSDALDEGKLSPKEDLNTAIGQQNNNNNLQPTQCSGNMKSQIVETKLLKNSITANSNKSEEIKIINSSDVLDEGKLSLKEEIFVGKLDTEIGWQHNENNLKSTQCHGKVKVESVEILSSSDMTANIGKLDKSEIEIDNTNSKIDILCAPENLKSNSNKIPQMNTEQFDSVFKDMIVTENQDSQKLEIETESNEDKLSLNTPHNIAMPGNSYITTDLASNNYTAPNVTNQSTYPINNDNNNSPSQNLDQENNNTSVKVYENLESNSNSSGENETNIIEEDEHLTKDCNMENNVTLERNLTENETGDGEKEQNTDFEQLLELENKINEEKVDMDEEYSCLMISNSQLAEIEKNYYESSQHTVANEVSKVSDATHVQFNPLIHNESMINYNCSKTEGKFNSGNVIGTQIEFGSQSSSESNHLNFPPKLPSIQWPKNMLEAQRKIRDLVGEVERLNSLLMGFRREIWPQKHSDSTST